VLTKYSTLDDIKEIKINIMKSVFIGNAKEVINHQEALDFLNIIKQKYPDASHHCWSYIIGNNKAWDDNGEPGGTAGIPILNVLKRNNLDNIIIIVTRYFGGKKLGVSGLIAAYRKAAENLIEKSIIIERRPGYIFYINCDYNYANKITSKKDPRIKVLAQEYTEEVSMEIFVEFEAAKEYESDFSNNNIQINSRIESIN
jgi:uncharacterized YigZ family protein